MEAKESYWVVALAENSLARASFASFLAKLERISTEQLVAGLEEPRARARVEVVRQVREFYLSALEEVTRAKKRGETLNP